MSTKRTSSANASSPSTSEASVKGRTVDFGSMSIHVGVPSADQIVDNVLAGQVAFKRARPVLVGRGVKLALKPSVPKYHADPDHPNLIVEELNGRRRLGTLSNGIFKPAP